jgi:hypothetical protein
MQQIETIQKLIKQNQLTSSNSKSLDVFAHSSHPSKLHKSICSVAQFVSGVPGEPWYPQFLADQLTLSQPRGVDYAHHILALPDFQTFLWPCVLHLCRWSLTSALHSIQAVHVAEMETWWIVQSNPLGPLYSQFHIVSKFSFAPNADSRSILFFSFSFK